MELAKLDGKTKIMLEHRAMIRLKKVQIASCTQVAAISLPCTGSQILMIPSDRRFLVIESCRWSYCMPS